MKWTGLTDGQHHVFDVVIKAVSGAFVVYVFFMGLKQFKTQNEVENKRIFYDKQIEYINDLVSVTAELSTPYPNERDTLISKFKSLYHGKLQFYVSDDTLIKFVTELNDICYFIEAGQQTYQGKPTVQAAQEFAQKIGRQSKKIIDKLYEVEI